MHDIVPDIVWRDGSGERDVEHEPMLNLDINQQHEVNSDLKRDCVHRIFRRVEEVWFTLFCHSAVVC